MFTERVWHRYELWVRIVMVPVLLGLTVFAGFMVELTLRDTRLECGTPTAEGLPCVQVETWLDRWERVTPLEPVLDDGEIRVKTGMGSSSPEAAERRAAEMMEMLEP